MTKNSLLAVALAFASFTALPALAQSTPSATPSPTVQGSTQTDMHKDKAVVDKTAAKPIAKSTDGKPQAQIAQHPADAKVKSDSTTKTDPVSK